VCCSLALVGRGFSGAHFSSPTKAKLKQQVTDHRTTDIVSVLQYQLSRFCALVLTVSSSRYGSLKRSSVWHEVCFFITTSI
jgi:hypothetical protein